MSKKPEEKVELAKTIAEQSHKVKRFSKRIGSFFRRITHFFSNMIDRLFFKEKYGAYVSLFVAIALFFMVSSSEQITSSVRSSIEINNIEVEVLANDDLYEITGVPESVNAIVQGEFVDLTTIRNQGNYSVVIDLIGLTEGVHIVNLSPTDFSPRVRVVLSPSSAEVTIRRKISSEFTFGYDFINTNQLSNEYVLGEPTFNESIVVVQASQETISQISHIKALIDVANQSETFETEATLVAYNQKGEQMNIDIIPETVTAKVEVTSPNKQVPLVLNVIGEIPDNKAIASYTMDTERITLYGPEDVLASIQSLEIPINAASLVNDETQIVHSISLPQGIRTADTERTQISIKLAEKIDYTVENARVFFENNTHNYTITFANEEDELMDVILRGSQAMIDTIDLSQVRVSIDMRQVEPGAQEVSVQVSGPSPFVVYELAKTTIFIDVEE